MGENGEETNKMQDNQKRVLQDTLKEVLEKYDVRESDYFELYTIFYQLKEKRGENK
jgi:hypothetical protein